MNKACQENGLLQATVHARFKKHPELYDIVKGNREMEDEEVQGDEEDEEAEDLEQMDVSEFGRGRGRKPDLPDDVEEAIARQIAKQIRRNNAPTNREILRNLVKQSILKLRKKGMEMEVRFKDDLPSDRWLDRFLKRHDLKWKRATKLGEARIMAITPKNVSCVFQAWREAMVRVAFDMWRVYCWDQTPLETDLPRRLKIRAVGFVGSDYQPIVRGRTTIGSSFMLWFCIGVMGQVLHPVVIFKGGGEIEEYEVDERRPGRPAKKITNKNKEEAAIVREAEVGPAVLVQNVPGELAEADENAEELDPDELLLIRNALEQENQFIEEGLPGDLQFKKNVKGRQARFRPASFPLECAKWGFVKQPNGCTDSYTAKVAFEFFVQQIEKEHPEGPKVVIMDNLGAHRQPGLIEYLLSRNIFPLFIPPNSTHRFMPLDRVFNGVFKHYYNFELRLCLGAGITPNIRVILWCVTRALDRMCPEVTKAGWRGFYPYDRVGMVSVDEQKAALDVKAKYGRGALDEDRTVVYSVEQIPSEIRLHSLPVDYVHPSQEEARQVLPLDFTQSDLMYRRRAAAIPAAEQAAAEQEVAEEDEEDSEGSDDDNDLAVDLQELMEEVGAPFQRQKKLGASKKQFCAIGLITAERARSEMDRMRRLVEEEDRERARKQEEKRAAAELRKQENAVEELAKQQRKELAAQKKAANEEEKRQKALVRAQKKHKQIRRPKKLIDATQSSDDDDYTGLEDIE